MKNRPEKHQNKLIELNNLNTTNAEVILLAQLAMLCYGSEHLCKITSSCLKSCHCLHLLFLKNLLSLWLLGVLIVSKIVFGGKFSVSRVTGIIVGSGLHPYKIFVLL